MQYKHQFLESDRLHSGLARFEKGVAVGDENIATENLRRFFEQHFHQGSDS